MLGAAHVLAMDSKNLLDVVDSIRLRYPHLGQFCATSEDFPVAIPDPEPQLPQSQSNNAFPNLPTPVSCTFVQFPMFTKNVAQSTTSSGASSLNNTTNIVDS